MQILIRPCLLAYINSCILVFPLGSFLFLTSLILFQPAARKGADKSGPGAGITVLSEKTLFLGQKVSAETKFFHKIKW